MAESIEPAIYIEGCGGFQIEDNLIITEDGCEVITPMPQIFPPIV